MKKKALSLLLALVVLLGTAPTALAAQARPAPSNNRNAQDYTVHGETVKSYLYASGDGGVTRVEYLGGRVRVEDYDGAFRLQSAREITPELPIWGGFYAGEEYLYLIFGQENPGQSDSAEVIRVVKYDRDWQRLGAASLSGVNTVTPFASGSLRCDEYQGYLYVRTCRDMYAAGDGVSHQANLTFAVREEDMTVSDAYGDVSNTDHGYVSHSLNQFLLVDQQGLLVAIDHGDAYPRGVVFMRYYADAAGGSFRQAEGYPWCSTGVQQSFRENSKDEWVTGASVGGLAETRGSYVTAYSYDGLGRSGDRQVFLNCVDRTTGRGNTYQLTEQGGASTPVLASTGLDGGFLLWNGKHNGSVDDTLYWSAYRSGTGSPGEVQSAQGASLSDCQPIPWGKGVLWYTTSDSAPVFYTLDSSGVTAVPANQADEAGRGELAYTQIIQPQYEDAGLFADNGLAAVKKDGKWGYIDTAGEEVIPFRYEMAFTFSEGLAVVFTEEHPDPDCAGCFRAAVLDEEGNETSLTSGLPEDGGGWFYPQTADSAGPARPGDVVFHNGWVKLGCLSSGLGDWLYGRDGKPAPCRGELFLADENLYEGLFPAYAIGPGNADVGWADAQGNAVKVFPQGREEGGDGVISRTLPFNQGLAPVWQASADPDSGETVYRVGFMDRDFQWAIQPRFSGYYSRTSDSGYEVFGASGLAMTAVDGLYGAIDKSGQTVIPFEYEMLQIDAGGRIAFRQEGKWGYLDADTLEEVVPARYQAAGMFRDGYAAVLEDGKAMLIDRWGEPIPLPAGLDLSCYFYTWNGMDMAQTPGEYVLLERGGRYGFGRISCTTGLPRAEEMDGWAYDTVLDAVQADLVPAELQCLYRHDITRREFCQLVVWAVERISGQDAEALVLERTGRSLSAHQQAVNFYDANDRCVTAAWALGIVDGRGGGQFDPYAGISRQEAAVLLARAAALLGAQEVSGGGLTYADSASVAPWAAEAVGYVSRTGVMNGTGGNRFSPLDKYTREQAILTICRLFLQFSPEGSSGQDGS